MLISELPPEGRAYHRSQRAKLGNARSQYLKQVGEVAASVITGMLDLDTAAVLFRNRTRMFLDTADSLKAPWPGPTGTLPETPLC